MGPHNSTTAAKATSILEDGIQRYWRAALAWRRDWMSEHWTVGTIIDELCHLRMYRGLLSNLANDLCDAIVEERRHTVITTPGNYGIEPGVMYTIGYGEASHTTPTSTVMPHWDTDLRDEEERSANIDIGVVLDDHNYGSLEVSTLEDH